MISRSWAPPSPAYSHPLLPLPLPKPHVCVMVPVEVSTLGSLPQGWGEMRPWLLIEDWWVSWSKRRT